MIGSGRVIGSLGCHCAETLPWKGKVQGLPIEWIHTHRCAAKTIRFTQRELYFGNRGVVLCEEHSSSVSENTSFFR